jgi:hypothetical protein
VFIPLVPWEEMLGLPNAGHEAISDMVICRAAHATLSTNYDRMIEAWAQNLKVDLRGALNGQEAIQFSPKSSPLLKFHGCIDRSREQTLWTNKQLADAEMQARIASCSQWMNLHLPAKHLVVVGFWSDWKYLNQIFSDAFTIDNAQSVTVIDKGSEAALQAKAPELWARLNGLSRTFEHVQESGAVVLEELRLEFSRTWARRLYSLGAAGAAPSVAGPGTPSPTGPTAPLISPGLNIEALYDLRRDAEGVPYTKAATLKIPAPNAAQASSMRLTLLNRGATEIDSWLRYDGAAVRIVNGGGHFLETVQSRFIEPPTMKIPDIVICAGATRSGTPARIIRRGRGKSVVRPSAGTGARWLTLEEAKMELGL